MARMYLPDARFRSPTAVGGKSDLRDENIYSAIVMANGGGGQQKVFTVPQGQAIPELKAAAVTATTNAHQTLYTELTTNLGKAGELGSAIGDASIVGIGAMIEQAAFTATTGAPRVFGGTPFEVADILSKTFFELKVAGKRQIIGPTSLFPTPGGAMGSISTTGNAATAGVVNNGWPGMPRKLRIPILIARTDAVEGVVGVAGSAALAFWNGNGTDSMGQPTLVTYVLRCLVKGDVR